MTVEWPPNTGPERSQENLRGHLARCARSVEENLYYAPSHDHYFNLLQRKFHDTAPFAHLDAIFLRPEDEFVVYLHKQQGFIVGLEVAMTILGENWQDRLMDSIDDLMYEIEGPDDENSTEQYDAELLTTSTHGWNLGRDFERSIVYLSQTSSRFCGMPELQDHFRQSLGFVFAAIELAFDDATRLSFRDQAENYIRNHHLWDTALISLLNEETR